MASYRSGLRLIAFGATLVLLSAFAVRTQVEADPDPNSPTPVVLTADESVRALAYSRPASLAKSSFAKVASDAYAPASQIVIFVTNLDLMKGEGANAFRVYAQAKEGKLYRFPVLDLQPLSGKPWIYQLTVKLTDDLGYFAPPTDGDLLVYVSWRGLASNTVVL